MEILKVHNHQIVTAKNKPLRLRGWNIGGWLNMEDFINGFVGAEYNLRATMSHCRQGEGAVLLRPSARSFLY